MDITQNNLVLEPTRHPAPRWCLTGQLTDYDSVQVINIDCSPFQIGRKEGLSLTLPSLAISYLHAEITVDHDALYIRDLASTNGTFKNGKRISRKELLEDGDQIKFADTVLRVNRTRVHESAQPPQEIHQPVEEEQALSDFDRILQMRTVDPHFQPMISLRDGAIVGYEVLARSSVENLRTPKEMFRAASRLNLEATLSSTLRHVGVQKGSMLWQPPRLFINTHPNELATNNLFESLRKIRDGNQHIPITLEICETAAQDKDLIYRLRHILTSLDMGLAYDQFGLGQIRRSELAAVRPDHVKFDINLIREIHLASAPQRALLANFVQMVRDLGIVPVAMGVENESEHECCRDIGFELAQGFYYGKPATSLSTSTSDSGWRPPCS
jgi:EAL domain-containing protein (putative c-di-GMP-specific phosphodiesterase class I)